MSGRIRNTRPRIVGSSPPLAKESQTSQEQTPKKSSSSSASSLAQSTGARAHATEARAGQDLKQATIQSELLNKVPSESTSEEALEDDILLTIDLPVVAAEARDAGVDEEELEDILSTAEDAGVLPTARDGGVFRTGGDGASATEATKAPAQAAESVLDRLAKSRKE